MSTTLEQLILAGTILTSEDEFNSFIGRAESFLEIAFDETTSKDFRQKVYFRQGDTLSTMAARGVGLLEGLHAKRAPNADSGLVVSDSHTKTLGTSFESAVFIVHGHDSELKETVARFIERLGLSAIILHEQPSRGATIIEKLENHSNVGFAIVLLSPDDVGFAKRKPADQRPRARQNVIFELGYFVAKLGRERVCALYADDIELPSDYYGVVYVRVDGEGAWRAKIAHELSEVGLPVNLTALLGT